MFHSSKLFSSVLLSSIALSIGACQSVSPVSNYYQPKMRKAFSTFNTQKSVPGQMMVKFKKGFSSQSVLRDLGMRKIKSIGPASLRLELIQAPQTRSIKLLLKELNQHPQIVYAEPNYMVKVSPILQEAEMNGQNSSISSFPNDPMFKKQYAHKKTLSTEGWKLNKGNKNITIAIVDTGVDLKHPDLAAKIVPGYDFVQDDTDASDVQGHGTHCAGIAAAITNNKIGVAGFAPKAKIMPVRVLGDNGSGSYADVAAGIAWAAENGADVISMSLGGPSSSKGIEDAVKLAMSKDSLVIAAMGNSGNGSKSYPAATPGVMAVGATNKWDFKAMYSQYGTWNSVVAPGSGILSTFPTYKSGMPGTSYGSISGTSMATPAVAGLAAMIRSHFPELNASQTRSHIEKTADDKGNKGFDRWYGHGRINVLKAMSTKPASLMTSRR